MRWKDQISRRKRKAGYGSIGLSAARDQHAADLLATQVQVQTTSDESLVRLRQENNGVEAAQTDEMSPARPKREGNGNEKRKRKGKEPELVIEGDRLTNTPQMTLLVYVSMALQVSYLLQVGCVADMLGGNRTIWAIEYFSSSLRL